MKRLLKPGGIAVVKEPVRFSKTFAAVRSLFPDKEDISADEHPLTPAEFRQLKEGWIVNGERSFRLPSGTRAGACVDIGARFGRSMAGFCGDLGPSTILRP